MATPLEALRKAKEALDKMAQEQKRQGAAIEQQSLLTAIAKNFNDTVARLFEYMTNHTQQVKDEMRQAVKEIKIEIPRIEVPPVEVKLPEWQPIINVQSPEVTVPEIKVPEIRIPEIKVPRPEVTVNIPEIKLPKIEIPKLEMPQDMRLGGIDSENPLHVILTDPKGNYASVGGSSGPRVVDKPRASTGVYNTVSIATTSTQISPAQGDRKSFGVVHESADTVYIGLNSSVTTVNGFPVISNQLLSFDDYVGAVFAIISNGASASTVSVRYIEF